MPSPSSLRVGRTPEGYRVRVEGRGTMRESPAAHDFAVQALEDGAHSLVLDLSGCEYLDSTFLGCLVDLHKRFGADRLGRFVVAVPLALGQKLLAPTRLNKLLNLSEARPEIIGEEMTIDPSTLSSRDLGHHILECHRRLAEVDGPRRDDFAQVVERLSDELLIDRPDRA